MVVAVVAYLTCGSTEDIWFDMFNQSLKDGTLLCFIENVMDGCFKQTPVFLLIQSRVEAFVPCFPYLEHCLPNKLDAF